jgi:hypothetical protein
MPSAAGRSDNLTKVYWPFAYFIYSLPREMVFQYLMCGLSKSERILNNISLKFGTGIVTQAQKYLKCG